MWKNRSHFKIFLYIEFDLQIRNINLKITHKSLKIEFSESSILRSPMVAIFATLYFQSHLITSSTVSSYSFVNTCLAMEFNFSKTLCTVPSISSFQLCRALRLHVSFYFNPSIQHTKVYFHKASFDAFQKALDSINWDHILDN